MNDQQSAARKNVAAQHHDEMATEHERDGGKLADEHDEPSMPAHQRETHELLREQEAQRSAGGRQD